MGDKAMPLVGQQVNVQQVGVILIAVQHRPVDGKATAGSDRAVTATYITKNNTRPMSQFSSGTT